MTKEEPKSAVGWVSIRVTPNISQPELKHFEYPFSGGRVLCEMDSHLTRHRCSVQQLPPCSAVPLAVNTPPQLSKDKTLNYLPGAL